MVISIHKEWIVDIFNPTSKMYSFTVCHFETSLKSSDFCVVSNTHIHCAMVNTWIYVKLTKIHPEITLIRTCYYIVIVPTCRKFNNALTNLYRIYGFFLPFVSPAAFGRFYLSISTFPATKYP